MFWSLLQVLLGASIVGFRLIVVLWQVSQSDGSFSFAIFLAAAKIHNMPTHTHAHTLPFTMCILCKIVHIYKHTHANVHNTCVVVD